MLFKLMELIVIMIKLSKYTSTAILSIILLSQGAEASHEDSNRDGESLPFRKRVRPISPDQKAGRGQDLPAVKELDRPVRVKLEPVDRLDPEVPAQHHNRESISKILKNFNPAIGGKRPKQNAFQCNVAFLNWVNSGVLVPALPSEPQNPNIIVRPKSTELLDAEAAAALPRHAIEIVMDEALDHINGHGKRVINFEPCAFNDLAQTTRNLPLRQVNGVRCLTGMISLGYLPDYLEAVKKANVKANEVTEGHIVNFYIYEEKGVRKCAVVDAHSDDIRMLHTFVKDSRKTYKDLAYIWCDTSGAPWGQVLRALKVEPEVASSPSVNSAPALSFDNDTDSGEPKRAPLVPIEGLEGADRPAKRAAMEPVEDIQQPAAQPQAEPQPHLHPVWMAVAPALDSQRIVHLQKNEWDLFKQSFMDGEVLDSIQMGAWTWDKAHGGNAEAQNYLGFMYNMGEIYGGKRDSKRAAEWYQKAASQGLAVAQCNLGKMYWLGEIGGKPDLGQAAIWIQKAADQGYAKAQYYLGEMYRRGQIDGGRNLGQAAIWIQKAADQGYAKAQYYLGEMYQRGDIDGQPDLKNAVLCYKKAADQGYAAAQLSMGLMYARGQIGGKPDLGQAVIWIQKAADQGLAAAQCTLGGMYRRGEIGGKPDLGQAALWFKKAADLGYAQAQYCLVVMYLHGQIGGKPDLGQAASWFQKAADQGYAKAQYNLGFIYSQGQIGGKLDLGQAASWYKKAADQGHAQAQYCFGEMYARGEIGGKPDLGQAASWLQKAADQGHVDAKAALIRLFPN
jgi:TPR repeat protein